MSDGKRMIRVNELLKREIAELLEARLEHSNDCIVSVTEVRTSPDLRHAKVFISVFGPQGAGEHTVKTLLKKRAYLQSKIARDLQLKFTPVLEFALDGKIENGDKVLSMISELEKEESKAK